MWTPTMIRIDGKTKKQRTSQRRESGVLTKTLRALERDGLVHRKPFVKYPRAQAARVKETDAAFWLR